MLLVCGMLVPLPFIWLNYLNHNVVQKGEKNRNHRLKKKKEFTDENSGIKVFFLFDLILFLPAHFVITCFFCHILLS